MICILALVVFSIMAIFSAAYRPVAKEAFDCVFRRITLRKCQSGLDRKLKSKITGKLLVKRPKAARFAYRYFEVFSWFFVLLLFASLGYSGYSGYNYVEYGNCNGPDSSGFCLFNALAGSGEGITNMNESMTPENVKKPAIKLDALSLGPKNANVTVLEVGCFQCPYTKRSEPWVEKLLKAYGDRIRFTYQNFPLTDRHSAATMAAEAAYCANEQDKFWEYKDKLFEDQEKRNVSDFKSFARELGLNSSKFDSCFDSGKYKANMKKDTEAGKAAGIYGTPTFFINDKVIVGPASYREIKRAVKEELKKWD